MVAGELRDMESLAWGLDDLSIVDDLSAVEQPLGSVRLRWSYKNTGDYDQNSETNISDLTPIGRHFNKTPASGDWNQSNQDQSKHQTQFTITAAHQCFLPKSIIPSCGCQWKSAHHTAAACLRVNENPKER